MRLTSRVILRLCDSSHTSLGQPKPSLISAQDLSDTSREDLSLISPPVHIQPLRPHFDPSPSLSMASSKVGMFCHQGEETTMQEMARNAVATLAPMLEGESEEWLGDRDTPQKSNAAVYTKIEFDNEGKLVLPPVGARLSDELVYLMVKSSAQRYRGKNHRADFTNAGDIKVSRRNEDPAPVIYCNGLPFFAVYKGYYVLAGKTGARLLGNKIAKKTNETLGASVTDFTIGPVVAPREVLGLPRSLTRQMHRFDGTKVTTKIHDAVRNDVLGHETKRRDIMSKDHHQLSMVYYQGEVWLHPIHDLTGYTINCSGKQNDKLSNTEYKRLKTGVAYSVAKRVAYENSTNPRPVSVTKLDTEDTLDTPSTPAVEKERAATESEDEDELPSSSPAAAPELPKAELIDWRAAFYAANPDAAAICNAIDALGPSAEVLKEEIQILEQSFARKSFARTIILRWMKLSTDGDNFVARLNEICDMVDKQPEAMLPLMEQMLGKCTKVLEAFKSLMASLKNDDVEVANLGAEESTEPGTDDGDLEMILGER